MMTQIKCFLLPSLHQWLLLLLLLLLFQSTWVSSAVPRLTLSRRRSSNKVTKASSSSSCDDDGNQLKIETFYYEQTLDHFGYGPDSYTTFKQKYKVDFRYWGGVNSSAPIFALLGDEASLEPDISAIGFLQQHAPQFKALVIYLEHRYYGQSIPFGSVEEAFRNSSTLGYLTAEQALADYAELILHIKKKNSAEDCPVIVFGGSYGGMLASWFRLKYPHVALGALASSAPVLYFEDIVPHDTYYAIVSKDFKDVSESCYNAIRQSWSEIDEIASKPKGLSKLSRRFKTCLPLNSSFELKDHLDSIYSEAAQYDSTPDNFVKSICDAINRAADKGADLVSRVRAGMVAYQGKRRCYDTKELNDPTNKIDGYHWQMCTEMVIPVGHGINSTMFQMAPFDLNAYSESCRKLYGVTPRPHWIVTEFGGRRIKLVLEKFASNIIFSNGLRDPYSGGGVLRNISDSIIALTTADGSHCMDLHYAKASDPMWLIEQRETEVKLIKGWIQDYYKRMLQINTTLHI